MSAVNGSPYEAIFFDFDGVLVDSEPLHYRCWSDVLAPYGIRFSWEDYVANCVGVADRALVERFRWMANRPVSFDKLWAEYPRKQALFRERMLAHVPMPRATRELLRRLQHFKLAVVSSSGRSEVEPALVKAGVRGYLKELICAEDVSVHKPSPEPYLEAARRLAVRRALVVEDSEAGQASGRAAGFDVLQIPNPKRTAELVAERLGLPPTG
jgi:beta-phosphoglucomutase